MAKTTMVILETTEDHVAKAFEFSHAERLLKRDTWQLPADSKYEFRDNGLHIRANKGKAPEREAD